MNLKVELGDPPIMNDGFGSLLFNREGFKIIYKKNKRKYYEKSTLY